LLPTIAPLDIWFVVLVQLWLVGVVCDCIIALLGPDMVPPVWAPAERLKALHAMTAAANLWIFIILS
jgi:hypothetical protein